MRLRMIFLVLSLFVLAGCWSSSQEQFLTKSLLVSDLPSKMLVTYNGNTSLVKRSKSDPTLYTGFGFEEMKFKRIKNGLLAQGWDKETEKFTFFAVNNNGDVAEQLRFSREVNLVLAFPNNPIVVQNNNFGIKVLDIGRPEYRKGTVRIVNIDNMSEAQQTQLLATLEEQSAGKRYDRALSKELLNMCSKRQAIAMTGSLSTALSRVRREGQNCVSENAFAKYRFGLADLSDLSCTGEGDMKTCTFSYGLTCLLTTTVSNNTRLNRQVCDNIRSLRQPARAQVRDNGIEVEFLSLELLQ